MRRKKSGLLTVAKRGYHQEARRDCQPDCMLPLMARVEVTPPTRPRRDSLERWYSCTSIKQILVLFAWQNRRLATLIRQSKHAPVSSPRAMIHEQADSYHPVITRFFPQVVPRQAGSIQSVSYGVRFCNDGKRPGPSCPMLCAWWFEVARIP